MAKSATIRARIEEHLKTDVETIFDKLGLSITEAITLFYNQVRLVKGLPFQVRLPNKTTLQTFQDTDQGKNMVQAKNAQDLFDKLGL